MDGSETGMEANLVALGRPEVLLPVDGRKRVGTNCGKIECVVLFFVDLANEDAVDMKKSIQVASTKT